MLSTPFIKIPDVVEKDKTFIIKAKMKHAMETGWRETQKGDKVPRKRINKVVVTFNDHDLFRANLHSGVSADPYLMFPAKLNESGVLRTVWIEDGGAEYVSETPIQLS